MQHNNIIIIRFFQMIFDYLYTHIIIYNIQYSNNIKFKKGILRAIETYSILIIIYLHNLFIVIIYGITPIMSIFCNK